MIAYVQTDIRIERTIFLNIGSRQQCNATSLAEIYTEPFCRLLLSTISASPASICSNAILICSYRRFPSGVSFTPLLVREKVDNQVRPQDS